MDKPKEKIGNFLERNKFTILSVFVAIIGVISIAALSISLEPKKSYTESLYSDVLNPATLKSTGSDNNELLYSYPLNAGQGSNKGFFTMVMTGGFDIPSITFDVQDQSGRSIISNNPVVGKTTYINFTGRDDTVLINLLINAKTSNISLSSLAITLER